MANYEGTLSAQILDNYGIPGQEMIMIEIPDTATLAQIATDVASFVALSDPLTAGYIPKAELRLTFPGDGLTGVQGPGDIEKGGLFNFSNATDAYLQGVLVPDLSPGVLDANGLISLTNTDVAAWITWMTTAHTAITVIAKGVRALTALKDALI